MIKLFSLLIFTTSLCFSQKEEFTMLQIDSIVKISRPSIELSGVLKKDKLIIGGYGITNFNYNDKIIYSFYNEETKDNKSQLNHVYEFYFSDEKPILIKLVINKIDIKTKVKEKFEALLRDEDLYESKKIKNPFSLELRQKLNTIIGEMINNKKAN